MDSDKPVIEYVDQLRRSEWKAKREEILTRDNHTCQKCKKSSIAGRFINTKIILHVHHKYYQLGFLAWEYPMECYITLCESCHTYFHYNRKTPVKDESGNIISHVRICSRCGGSGYMPQYNHVEGGTCFKCNGQGLFNTFDGIDH